MLENLVCVKFFGAHGKLIYGKFESIKPEIENNTVIIEWIHYGIAGSNYRLRTDNIYTCMGIILYDSILRVGLLAHMAREEYEKDNDVNELIKEFSGELRAKIGGHYNPSNFNCAIIGASSFTSNSLSDEAVKLYTQETSGYITKMAERLKNTGFRVFEPFQMGLVTGLDITRWVILNNASGEVTIKGFLADDMLMISYPFKEREREKTIEDIILQMNTGEIIVKHKV